MSSLARENNFDFLRLLFASSVIISHSYPLTEVRDKEILMVITNGQLDLGGFSVACFFIISGYLIYQSLERSSSIKNYIWKRVLRLYPALIVMLLLTVSVVPFFYQGEGSILNNTSYFTYLPRQLSLYNLQHNILGVFEDLPYKTINGSLWTICYEFTMYMLLVPFYFIKSRWRLGMLLILFFLFYLLSIFFPLFLNNRLFSKFFLFSPNFYNLGCFFSAGALLTYLTSKINSSTKWLIIIIGLVALIGSIYFEQYKPFKYFVLPFVVILFGTSSTPIINKVGKTIGDNSYGIYIYGWLVQQSLLYVFGLNTYCLMFFSLVISFVLGWLSWHFVEKKALEYKNLIR
ncbi:acyltransferase family protein [Riemerella anatipestifer]|uniref:acyltransferase family protein n=1 Tax=Riemerella anatipestifer TaxID=34085 RepID=UPI0030C177A2